MKIFNNIEMSFLTATKYISAMIYSIVMSAVAVKVADGYEAVFTDIFFYISGFLGAGLMIFVKIIDDKVKLKPTVTQIIFSIFACLTVFFGAGTYRANTLETGELERDYWFYLIVIFLCAIAPEFVKALLGDGGKSYGESAKKRINKIISGESEIPSEDLFNEKTESNEQ